MMTQNLGSTWFRAGIVTIRGKMYSSCVKLPSYCHLKVKNDDNSWPIRVIVTLRSLNYEIEYTVSLFNLSMFKASLGFSVWV